MSGELSSTLKDRYVYRVPSGWRVQIPSAEKTKTFSTVRYGSSEAAKLAAVACRNRFLETGELSAPLPPHPAKAVMAKHLGVTRGRFYTRVARTSLAEAVRFFRDEAATAASEEE